VNITRLTHSQSRHPRHLRNLHHAAAEPDRQDALVPIRQAHHRPLHSELFAGPQLAKRCCCEQTPPTWCRRRGIRVSWRLPTLIQLANSGNRNSVRENGSRITTKETIRVFPAGCCFLPSNRGTIRHSSRLATHNHGTCGTTNGPQRAASPPPSPLRDRLAVGMQIRRTPLRYRLAVGMQIRRTRSKVWII
jgi:hypothetical protein